MRTTFALALLLAACGGGGGLGTNTDGAGNGSHDLAASPGSDLASHGDLASNGNPPTDGGTLSSSDLGGVACGTMTCGTGTSCCIDPAGGTPTYACATSCGDMGITASCDGPEDCSSGTCCAMVSLSGNSATGDTMCSSPTTDCSMGDLETSGAGTLTTKLCHQPSDCAGYQGNFGPFTSCCTFPGVSYQFCAPSLANGLMGITCQ